MRPTLKRFLLLAGLAAAGQTAALAQNQEAIALGDLPPITPTYRADIVDWSRFFFAEGGPLRAARLSDPVLIRDSTGRLLWLVCLDAEASSQAATGRYAFGFAPGYFTAPRQRDASSLVNSICDERPLAYRPFAELTRGAAAGRRSPAR